MNRRGFVKALAALPAAAVGLAAGANIVSRSGPAEAARSVAPVAAGRLPLPTSIPVGHTIEAHGFPLNVSVSVDGKEIVGKVESFELDFRRDFHVGEFGIGEARVAQPGFCEMEVSIKVDDQFSVKLQEIADEAKLAAEEMSAAFDRLSSDIARRFQQEIESGVLADDCHCRSYHRRTGLHVPDCPLSDDGHQPGYRQIFRTSKPARLA